MKWQLSESPIFVAFSLWQNGRVISTRRIWLIMVTMVLEQLRLPVVYFAYEAYNLQFGNPTGRVRNR